jgi:hypothetical protein
MHIYGGQLRGILGDPGIPTAAGKRHFRGMNSTLITPLDAVLEAPKSTHLLA